MKSAPSEHSHNLLRMLEKRLDDVNVYLGQQVEVEDVWGAWDPEHAMEGPVAQQLTRSCGHHVGRIGSHNGDTGPGEARVIWCQAFWQARRNEVTPASALVSRTPQCANAFQIETRHRSDQSHSNI